MLDELRILAAFAIGLIAGSYIGYDGFHVHDVLPALGSGFLVFLLSYPLHKSFGRKK